MTRYDLMAISGETTVPAELLLENDDFLELAKSGASVEDLTDWVNENY